MIIIKQKLNKNNKSIQVYFVVRNIYTYKYPKYKVLKSEDLRARYIYVLLTG